MSQGSLGQLNIQDGVLQEVPVCGMKNCNNKAAIWWSTRWVCGDCAIKLHHKQKEIERQRSELLFEEIENNE